MADKNPLPYEGDNKEGELAKKPGERSVPPGEHDASDFVGGEPEGTEKDKKNV